MKGEIKIMNENYEGEELDNIVILNDEDGNEVKFEFLDCEIENTKMVYDNYKYLSSVISFISKNNLENNK